MTHREGAGTRHVNQGTRWTSAADETSACAATCGIQPAQCAAAGNVAAIATPAIPPICTMAINGTAAKLNARPATVTREKNSGPSGSSASSAAAEAASNATAGRSSRGSETAAVSAGTPMTI